MNNLSYEDARELKDAGFPQSMTAKTNILCEKHGDKAPTIECGDCSFVKSPTLSELIEACGEEFRDLHLITGDKPYDWVATAVLNLSDELEDIVTEMGDTPEQAVKNLWIALNKK